MHRKSGISLKISVYTSVGRTSLGAIGGDEKMSRLISRTQTLE
jgi:hypothetical protein